MCWTDFVKHFTNLDICLLNPAAAKNDDRTAWNAASHQGSWQMYVNAGGATGPMYHSNPQFIMALGGIPPEEPMIAGTGDSAAEAWLQMALRTAATMVPLARGRRGLVYMVLEVSRDRWRAQAAERPEASHSITTDEALMQYENMLTNVGTALGLAKQPTTTKAKTHLRELGQEGGVLASRLGQLSKVRNRRAHPGATHRLLAQVQQLVRTIKHDSSSKEPEEEATFYKEKKRSSPRRMRSAKRSQRSR